MIRSRGHARFRRWMVVAGLPLVCAPFLGLTPAFAAGECDAAQALAQTRRLSSAQRLYAIAAKAGETCATGPEAEETRARLTAADAARSAGQAKENAGDVDGALASYLAAVGANVEDTQALGGITRLTAGASPSPPTPTPSPSAFAPALELDRLGRDADAQSAAVDAVKKGATPVDGTPEFALVDVGWLEQQRAQVVAWAGLWWPVAATVIVGGLLAARQFGKWWRVRPLAGSVRPLRWLWRFRLSTRVTQHTGLETDYATAFDVQLRSRIEALSRHVGSDPRFTYGTDAKVEVELDDLPPQARFFAAAAKWWWSANTLCATVTLLPATRDGRAQLHMVLTEASGALARRSREAQVTFVGEPVSHDGAVDGARWLGLVDEAAAWSIYAFRDVSTPNKTFRRLLGTENPRAFGKLQSGLARIEEDPMLAESDFREARELDDAFLEAKLNLGFVLSASDLRPRLREACSLLTGLQTTLEAPATPIDPGRRAALSRRARYNLIIAKINDAALDWPPSGAGRAEKAAARSGIARKLTEIAGLAQTLHGELPQGAEDAMHSLDAALTSHLYLLAAGPRYGATLLAWDPYATPRAAAPRLVEPLLDGDGLPVLAQGAFTGPVAWDTPPAEMIQQYFGRYPETWRGHYSLACIWARQASALADRADEARTECAKHLVRASVLYQASRIPWTRDPDLTAFFRSDQGRALKTEIRATAP